MMYMNSCCCTCLSTENLHNIQNKDAENVMILEKLMYCLTEKDSIFECAPLLICDKCYKMLQELYNFKKTSLKNLDLFRDCLKQLIRNPFSGLRVQGNDKQTFASTSTDSFRQEIANQSMPQINQESLIANVEIGAIIKLEQMESDVGYAEYTEEVQQQSTRNEGETSNQNPEFSIQIKNVESLRRNYKQRVAKKSSLNYSENSSGIENTEKAVKIPETNKSKGRFHGSTCPCGKKFVRYDYYINHTLTCTKSDIKTKNSVLNWISKQTRSGDVKINPTTLNLLKNYSYKSKNNLGNAKSDSQNLTDELRAQNLRPGLDFKLKNVFRGRSKQKDKFQRTVCNLCKRHIAARFFKRHYARCCGIAKLEEKKDDKSDDTPTVFPTNDENIANDENVTNMTMTAAVSVEQLAIENN